MSKNDFDSYVSCQDKDYIRMHVKECDRLVMHAKRNDY
jgi:hypothetical protein